VAQKDFEHKETVLRLMGVRRVSWDLGSALGRTTQLGGKTAARTTRTAKLLRQYRSMRIGQRKHARSSQSAANHAPCFAPGLCVDTPRVWEAVHSNASASTINGSASGDAATLSAPTTTRPQGFAAPNRCAGISATTRHRTWTPGHTRVAQNAKLRDAGTPMKATHLSLSALAMVGCLGCGAEDRALLDEPAVFQRFRVTATWGECAAGEICEDAVEIEAGGRIVYDQRGKRHVGQIPTGDLQPFADFATSADVVTELRREQGCRGGTDMTETMEIGVARGLYVRGETAGCATGPLATVRAGARAIAWRIFPETRPAGSTEPTTLIPGRSAGLHEQATFYAAFLHRAWGPCESGHLCIDDVSIEPKERFVARVADGERQLWTGVTSFEPFSGTAVGAQLLTVLRNPAPCPGGTDASESVVLGVGQRLYVRADIAGCVTGPVADLRAAAAALVNRLSGSAAGGGSPGR
jgi:hypothetical protein